MVTTKEIVKLVVEALSKKPIPAEVTTLQEAYTLGIRLGIESRLIINDEEVPCVAETQDSQGVIGTQGVTGIYCGKLG